MTDKTCPKRKSCLGFEIVLVLVQSNRALKERIRPDPYYVCYCMEYSTVFNPAEPRLLMWGGSICDSSIVFKAGGGGFGLLCTIYAARKIKD